MLAGGVPIQEGACFGTRDAMFARGILCLALDVWAKLATVTWHGSTGQDMALKFEEAPTPCKWLVNTKAQMLVDDVHQRVPIKMHT